MPYFNTINSRKIGRVAHSNDYVHEGYTRTYRMEEVDTAIRALQALKKAEGMPAVTEILGRSMTQAARRLADGRKGLGFWSALEILMKVGMKEEILTNLD